MCVTSVVRAQRRRARRRAPAALRLVQRPLGRPVLGGWSSRGPVPPWLLGGPASGAPARRGWWIWAVALPGLVPVCAVVLARPRRAGPDPAGPCPDLLGGASFPAPSTADRIFSNLAFAFSRRGGALYCAWLCLELPGVVLAGVVPCSTVGCPFLRLSAYCGCTGRQNPWPADGSHGCGLLSTRGAAVGGLEGPPCPAVSVDGCCSSSWRDFAVAAMDAVPLTREGRGLGVGRLPLSSSLLQCSYCSCSGAPFMCLCCGDAYVTTRVAHRCCGVVSAHVTFRLRPTTQVVSRRWAVSVARRFSITSTMQCLGLVY